MLEVINPDGFYEENMFQEFLGQPTHKLLTDARRAHKVRHYSAVAGNTRFYKGSDVIAWMEQFAVEVDSPAHTEPAPAPAPAESPKPAPQVVPLVTDGGKGFSGSPKGK